MEVNCTIAGPFFRLILQWILTISLKGLPLGGFTDSPTRERGASHLSTLGHGRTLPHRAIVRGARGGGSHPAAGDAGSHFHR